MRTIFLLSLLLAVCMLPQLPAQELEEAVSGPEESTPAATTGGDSLLDLDLDQLSNVDVVVPSLAEVVTSVTREPSTVGRTPAAVFVITPEMIKRSGANTLPEVFRMVPGVQVARIDSSRWAITARGFNGRFANKLLVQIDGRAVYDPLYGGVFWDNQDIVLDDIERIEVVRGPGATVWGSNAVNGVINVITKHSKDTQGTLARVGGGTEERAFVTGRYGGGNGKDLNWRVYGKHAERDDGFLPGGLQHDGWNHGRGGFRTDWNATPDDLVTVQGDAYEGMSAAGGAVYPFLFLNTNDHNRGVNLLSRWSRKIDDDWGYSVQFYYDRIERDSEVVDYTRDTLDIDFQSNYRIGDHNFVWGVANRFTHDEILGTFNLFFTPPQRSTNLVSAFVQDEITLQEDSLYLFAGSKFENNSFTGFEYQPSLRLLMLPNERSSAWASVSRAVRIPSRLDDDLIANGLVNPGPPATFLQYRGDRSVVAEDLIAYELGYRAQPEDFFSWDVAGFLNVYDNVHGVRRNEPPVFDPPNLFVPIVRDNVIRGESYGLELATTMQMTQNWQLYSAYTFLVLNMRGSDADAIAAIEGYAPRNQVYVRSSWDVCQDVQFDLIGRYVDNLSGQPVPNYLEMDLRLAWKPRPALEMAVVGQNLLDAQHYEFIDMSSEITSTEVQRGVYGVATYLY